MRADKEDIVRVNIALPVTVRDAVAAYAKRKNRSASNYMAAAISETVRREEKEDLEGRLHAAYTEMSEELLSGVNECDPGSREAWMSAYEAEATPRGRGRRKEPGSGHASR